MDGIRRCVCKEQPSIDADSAIELGTLVALAILFVFGGIGIVWDYANNDAMLRANSLANRHAMQAQVQMAQYPPP